MRFLTPLAYAFLMSGSAAHAPAPDSLVLLNQTGAPDVKAYLQGFIGKNLPHRNVAIMAQGDDPKAEMQNAMEVAIDRRPGLKQRLGMDTGLQQAIAHYIDTAGQAVKVSRDEIGYTSPEGYTKGPAGNYHWGTNAPASLRQEGLDIMALSLEGHSGCRGCRPDPQGPIACADAVTPAEAAKIGTDRLAKQSIFPNGVNTVLASIGTAFHELAHGMDLHGRSQISLKFEVMFGHKQFSSKAESTADAFKTLMLVREFSEIGRIHAKSEIDPITIPAPKAGHYTTAAVRKSLIWAKENPEKLKNMSVEEVFNQSRKIGHREALTQEEAVDFDSYLQSIRQLDFTPRFRTDIVDRYREDRAGASPFAAAKENAQTRVELGRLIEAGLLACPAKPEESQPAAAELVGLPHRLGAAQRNPS